MMTPRERVRTALAHEEPDFTPCDYFSTPEIHLALLKHFGLSAEDDDVVTTGGNSLTTGRNALTERLGTDIRYVNAPYTGPPLPTFDDGSTIDIWGIRRIKMPNEYGEYAEAVNTPYAAWTTVEQAEGFDWPDPDWFDYEAMPGICEPLGDTAIAAGAFNIQDFINAVAYGRGVEQVLVDIALEDPVYLYIVERRHQFFMRHIERILDAAAGRIDLVLCGDDFGSQRGLLISPEKFDRIFAPKKKELFDLIHAFGAKVTHHCCGSSRDLIPRFIECGMDSLQTIQARAAGMDPYELKKAFRGQLTLHGAVDVQGWLQAATPEEIEQEVNHLMDEVGAGGGFIIAPSHQIQPDTPLENVLAFYRTVARRRGVSLD